MWRGRSYPRSHPRQDTLDDFSAEVCDASRLAGSVLMAIPDFQSDAESRVHPIDRTLLNRPREGVRGVHGQMKAAAPGATIQAESGFEWATGLGAAKAVSHFKYSNMDSGGSRCRVFLREISLKAIAAYCGSQRCSDSTSTSAQ